MNRITTALATAALLAGSTIANAADMADVPLTDPIPAVSPWTIEVGIYGFVPISVQGTSTVDGGDVDLDLGPNEIFDLFEFAISGRAEAWRDGVSGDGSGFGLVLDGQYVNLGLNKSSIGPRSAGTVDVDIRQGIVDLLIGYRLPRIELDPATGQALIFDVMAGGRYNYLRQQIDVTPGLPFPFTANLGGDRHWVEPVIAGRATWQVTPRWDLILRGDLSGFGVNGNHLSWSAAGIVAWEAWRNTTLRLGYRAFGMDYSDGSGANEFAFDAVQHGPYFGLSYRFQAP